MLFTVSLASLCVFPAAADTTASIRVSVWLDAARPAVTLGPPAPAIANHAGVIEIPVVYVGAASVDLGESHLDIEICSGNPSAQAQVLDDATATPVIRLSELNGNGTFRLRILPGSSVSPSGQPDQGSEPSALITVDNEPPLLDIGPPSVSAAMAGAPVEYTVAYIGADRILLSEALIALETTGSAAGVCTVSGEGDSVRTVTVHETTGPGTIAFLILAGSAVDDAGNEAEATGLGTAFTVQPSMPLTAWPLGLGLFVAGICALRRTKARKTPKR